MFVGADEKGTPMHLCNKIDGTKFEIGGVVGEYLRNVSEQWLKIAPLANPGMLEMFRDRDRKPYRDLVGWAGEFAGKYLTAAAQVLRLTGDPQLRKLLRQFVGELISLQAADGYLGPWPQEYRLANRAPNVSNTQGEVRGNWDTWGLYHMMMGLMLWCEVAADQEALAATRRIADLLCKRFLGAKRPRLVELGDTEMNLAPAHALAILHRKTGQRRYLQLAMQLVEEFGAKDAQGNPLAGDYLHGPLSGLAFHQLPKPRWESLHPVMALAELHDQLGRNEYCQAFQRIWRSIVRGDRHNNGGFSSGEKATGNPYDQGAIETCCTIAWMALSVEMLRLSRDSQVADELELSLLNSVTGMHNSAGRWATYNTPMDGVRIASAQQIVFQAREGTPELNCCSVNSPRGFGLLSEWALMQDAERLVLNAYGPMTLRAPLDGPGTVTLRQRTKYPLDGKIAIDVSPRRKTEFSLSLRIPRWSARTRVRVNGETVPGVQPGEYLTLHRTWSRGDVVEISLDLGLHFWTGRRECQGKTSIYRGPLLLTYDRRYNSMDPDDIPVLDAGNLTARRVRWKHWLAPLLLLEFTARDGRKLRLCDFGSAGEGGSPYRSWLKMDNGGRQLPEYFSPESQS